MRCAILTALFFAFFALFSTMAYAAPVAPQGTIVKRYCMGPLCREATAGPSDSSNDRYTALVSVLTNLANLLGGSNNSNNNSTSGSNDLAIPTTPEVTTLPSSDEVPAVAPTGL